MAGDPTDHDRLKYTPLAINRNLRSLGPPTAEGWCRAALESWSLLGTLPPALVCSNSKTSLTARLFYPSRRQREAFETETACKTPEGCASARDGLIHKRLCPRADNPGDLNRDLRSRGPQPAPRGGPNFRCSQSPAPRTAVLFNSRTFFGRAPGDSRRFAVNRACKARGSAAPPRLAPQLNGARCVSAERLTRNNVEHFSHVARGKPSRSHHGGPELRHAKGRFFSIVCAMGADLACSSPFSA